VTPPGQRPGKDRLPGCTSVGEQTWFGGAGTAGLAFDPKAAWSGLSDRKGVCYDGMEPGTHRVCLSCGDRCCGTDRVRVDEPAASLPNHHGSVTFGDGCSQQQHNDSASATTHLNRRTDRYITGRHHSGFSHGNRNAGVSHRVSYQ